jgi:hypothetical protein
VANFVVNFMVAFYGLRYVRKWGRFTQNATHSQWRKWPQQCKSNLLAMRRLAALETRAPTELRAIQRYSPWSEGTSCSRPPRFHETCNTRHNHTINHTMTQANRPRHGLSLLRPFVVFLFLRQNETRHPRTFPIWSPALSLPIEFLDIIHRPVCI